MNWRISGVEQTRDWRPEADRRHGEVTWTNGVGLGGTAWVLKRLRQLDGAQVPLTPEGPFWDVDLGDPVSVYWAATTVYYRCTPEGDCPETPWRNPPPGAVN